MHKSSILSQVGLAEDSRSHGHQSFFLGPNECTYKAELNFLIQMFSESKSATE